MASSRAHPQDVVLPRVTDVPTRLTVTPQSHKKSQRRVPMDGPVQRTATSRPKR
jgi:hypothetical protein